MGSFEAASAVLTRIKNLDPEHASRIMGYLLVHLEETELVRLACSPDSFLHTLILRVKTQLGFKLSAPTSPSPLNPIARPISSIPFSHSSPRIANPSSTSSHAHSWPLSEFPNNPISLKSSPLLPYENIRSGSVSTSSFSPRVNANSDFVDEPQMNELFSFLNESPENKDVVDPGLELHNWHSVNYDDAPFHRRSYSASDVCFGHEEAGAGINYRPCLYFARGFCKNGSNCQFVHGALTDSLDATSGAIVGSPSKLEEFHKFKAAQHQRSVAALQLVVGASPSSYDKHVEFLMQQQNDPRRAAALMSGLELYNFSRYRPDRNDFLAIVSAEKPNNASRQIYLTFPAESTFKDEDVSEYFSKFGPVQDVRIPYQQKRMFGFVTFVYPETVRLILSKGNPHFICDSRVLVKPYKEKGKLSKRQQHQDQQLEGRDFSPCISPSGFDSKEPHDFHLGARMFYNPHEVLLRRKLEEQAELQQAIEFQERRLMNLQLPDFKNNHIHHYQRGLSVGAHLPLPQRLHSHIGNAGLSSDSIKGDITDYNGSLTSTATLAEQQEPQLEVDPACTDDTDSGKRKDSANAEVLDLINSLEQALPDGLFASPTKAVGDNVSDFSASAEVNESAVFSSSSPSHKKLESLTTSSDMASH